MNTPLLIGVAAFALCCLILVVPLVTALRRQERAVARLASVQQRAVLGDRVRRNTATGSSVGAIARFGQWLAARLLSAKTMREVQDTLGALGFAGSRAVGVFVAAKVVLFLLLPPVGYGVALLLGMTGNNLMLATAAGAVAGLLLPEMVVRNLRKRYLTQVERGIADGLDMIVICSEAGLGMETGIQRTALELRPAWPAFANELAMTASELRILSDRRAALSGMGERTQIEALRRLARVMMQSQQYGTPLSQALRVLAAELRQEQLIAFEARAAKLPVLLTVPMIMFILPTVFLVVAGPAILGILKFM